MAIPKKQQKTFVKNLPSDPGVYQMFDAAAKVIYVGKAKNLKKRVKSYFRPHDQLDAKTRALMQRVREIKVTVTGNEYEALLLENNLIKELKPHYNILFKDDKSFPFLALSKETFPRLFIYRGVRRDDAEYFGPYPAAHQLRDNLVLLEKIFLLRSCSNNFFSHRSRPCLKHEIGRCSAPCVGVIKEKEYAEKVALLRDFLRGESRAVQKGLEDAMRQASQNEKYELASAYRDQIFELKALLTEQFIVTGSGNFDVVAVACGNPNRRLGQAPALAGADPTIFDVVAVPCGSSERRLGQERAVGWVKSERQRARTQHSSSDPTIAPYEGSNQVAVQLFCVRHGALIASKSYFTSGVVASAAEILSAFLTQDYLSASESSVNAPEKILVNVKLAGQKLLEDFLERHYKKRVKILVPQKGKLKTYLDLAVKNAHSYLKQRLANLSNYEERIAALATALHCSRPLSSIECFDISHTAGEAAVASCVVFDKAGPVKNSYRRFNIKSAIVGGDDYGALSEALMRRYSHLVATESKLPDIILIDGGKGQLHVAEAVLKSLGLSDKILLLSIAKGEGRKSGLEQIYLSGSKAPLAIPSDTLAFHFLQEIRDAAHHFAITSHRKRRAKARFGEDRCVVRKK